MEDIAFDAHKHYTLASVEREDGRRVREERIAHDRGALRGFLARCERGSPVAVETVGNWYWIVDEIEAAVCAPRLVHARKAKLMMGQINKTDTLLDGVYTRATPPARPIFHRLAPPTDADITALLTRLHRRVRRLLARRGRWPGDDAGSDPFATQEPLFAQAVAASLQGRVALGPRAGQALRRLRSAASAQTTAPRCARLEGFSLHADVAVPARRRDRLEHLVRYVLRPPLALARLTESTGGQLLYQFRRPWRDGSTALLMEPLELLERLAALVPPPRRPLVAYHGVLAPRARWRAAIVPPPAHDRASADAGSRSPGRLSWARLLRRVFAIQVLVCERCGGSRRILGAVTEPHAVRRLLVALGLAAEPPPGRSVPAA